MKIAIKGYILYDIYIQYWIGKTMAVEMRLVVASGEK